MKINIPIFQRFDNGDSFSEATYVYFQNISLKSDLLFEMKTKLKCTRFAFIFVFSKTFGFILLSIN